MVWSRVERLASVATSSTGRNLRASAMSIGGTALCLADRQVQLAGDAAELAGVDDEVPVVRVVVAVESCGHVLDAR